MLYSDNDFACQTNCAPHGRHDTIFLNKFNIRSFAKHFKKHKICIAEIFIEFFLY